MTTPPSFRKVNPGDFPILFIANISATLPLSTVHEYADTVLAQQISQLPGVAQVLVYGAQKFAVRVQVDPEAAAARGLSLDDVRTAVSKANSSVPTGTLTGPRQNIILEASGQLEKAADYRSVVVAWRNGAPIKLEEIARVIDSVENDKIASWFNGQRSIVLAIQRQPDANTVEVVDSIRARLPALRAQVPPSIRLETLMDRSLSVRQAVHDVQETLLIAVALVIMVIFLFLRSASATAIPALAVPISLDRHLRGDVRVRLLAQQHDAPGVDAVGRLRGRRRHRHAREHRAPHRRRHAAVRGGAQGCARDRLYHHLDHVLSDRSVHPGAADGRRGRARSSASSR